MSRPNDMMTIHTHASTVNDRMRIVEEITSNLEACCETCCRKVYARARELEPVVGDPRLAVVTAYTEMVVEGSA